MILSVPDGEIHPDCGWALPSCLCPRENDKERQIHLFPGVWRNLFSLIPAHVKIRLPTGHTNYTVSQPLPQGSQVFCPELSQSLISIILRQTSQSLQFANILGRSTRTSQLLCLCESVSLIKSL